MIYALKKLFFTLYAFVTIASIFVGLYMMIRYMGKDDNLTFIFMGILIFGIFLLIIYAVILFYRKGNKNNNDDKEPK